jgi:hypothetical protein
VFSAMPKKSAGNSSIAPSTPLTRAIPSPIEITRPTSDRSAAASLEPRRARIAVEINSGCTGRSSHASVLSGTRGLVEFASVQNETVSPFWPR